MLIRILDLLALIGCLSIAGWLIVMYFAVRAYFRKVRPLDIDVTIEEEPVDLNHVNDQLADAFGSYMTSVAPEDRDDEGPTLVLEGTLKGYNSPEMVALRLRCMEDAREAAASTTLPKAQSYRQMYTPVGF